MDIKNLDIEKVAKAIELDAGQEVPGLRESLEEVKRGDYVVHTPDVIKARRGRPVGSGKKERPKEQLTVRFDADVIEAFRQSGAGWQTRMNDVLREWLVTHQVS
jgi:uncharacterized protein (DUF4415 family)